MRIIVTNDDGVQALGYALSIQALAPYGQLFAVAPEIQRSACGHGITLSTPLRKWRVNTGLPADVWACNGLPADCVQLAYSVLAEEKADLVVSGINAGANLGWDLTYSGTVAAAMEGAVLGVPSVAISVAAYENGEPISYEAAVRFLKELMPLFSAHRIPKHCLLNVNCPNAPMTDIKGVRVVRQGTRQYKDRLEARKDPWGNTYYWLGGSLVADTTDEGTDVAAVEAGYIAVTPVHLDLTHYESLEAVSEWLRPLQ